MTGITCERHSSVFVVYDSTKFKACPVCKLQELFSNEHQLSKACLKLTRLINRTPILALEHASKAEQDQNNFEANKAMDEIEAIIEKGNRIMADFLPKAQMSKLDL